MLFPGTFVFRFDNVAENGETMSTIALIPIRTLSRLVERAIRPVIISSSLKIAAL